MMPFVSHFWERDLGTATNEIVLLPGRRTGAAQLLENKEAKPIETQTQKCARRASMLKLQQQQRLPTDLVEAI